MEPASILSALIAGASLALHETASQAVKDAYAGLKALLIDRFAVGSVTMLEKDPRDEDFRQSVEKEIRLTPDLQNAPEVQDLVSRLYAAIEENTPEETLNSVGLSIRKIRSERDTIIRNVSGFEVGVKSDGIESGQDTVIEGIAGKPKT
jgi:hypothetical protein